MSENKGVMAERLARWLHRVLAAGREVPGGGSEDNHGDGLCDRPRPQTPFLVEHATSVGETPDTDNVSPEQAENALGRALATEVDIDYPDAVAAESKEEDSDDYTQDYGQPNYIEEEVNFIVEDNHPMWVIRKFMLYF